VQPEALVGYVNDTPIRAPGNRRSAQGAHHHRAALIRRCSDVGTTPIVPTSRLFRREGTRADWQGSSRAPGRNIPVARLVASSTPSEETSEHLSGPSATASSLSTCYRPVFLVVNAERGHRSSSRAGPRPAGRRATRSPCRALIVPTCSRRIPLPGGPKRAQVGTITMSEQSAIGAAVAARAPARTSTGSDEGLVAGVLPNVLGWRSERGRPGV
jgi:hypothetical protein